MLKLKRFLGVLLVVTLLATTLVFTVAASDIETVGLVSSHSRIRIGTDRVGVFSTPWHASWKVTSTLLLSKLSSSNGYTLSYVNSSKVEATSTDIRNGYVKASKDGADIYIPIVTKMNVTDFDLSTSSYFQDSGLGQGAYSRKGSIGGKSTEDLADAITIGATSPTAWALKNLDFANKGGFVNTVPFTYAFNIYADGDTVMRINKRYGSGANNSLFVWNTSGQMLWTNGTDGPPSATVSNVTRGRWHRVAITWDPRGTNIDADGNGAGRYELYLDGVRLGSAHYYATTNGDGFTRLTLGADTISKNGVVAFDNFTGWYGCYDPDLDGDVIKTSALSGIAFKNDTKQVTIDNSIATVSQLSQKLLSGSNVNDIKVFKDGTMSEQAATISTGNVLMVQLQGGAYYYYNVVVEVPDEFNTAYVRESFDSVALDTSPNNKLSLQLYRYPDAGKNPYSSYGQKGLGGKSSTDNAFVIKSDNAEGVKAGYNAPQLDLADKTGLPNSIVTAEVSMYAQQTTIDVLASLGINGDLTDLVKLSKDGYIYVYNEKTNMKYRANQWYKVAATANIQDKTLKIYLNGELMKTLEDINFTSIATRFRLASLYDLTAGPFSGVAAFDDFKLYGITYDPTDDFIFTISDSPSLVVEDSVLRINSFGTLTKTDVINGLQTNALTTEIYTDATLQTAVESNAPVSEGNVILLKSASGEVFKYLTLALPVLSRINVSNEDGILSATITVNESDENLLFVIVEYSGNMLIKTDLKKITANELKEQMIVSLAYRSANKYKIFLWNENLRPIASQEYNN